MLLPSAAICFATYWLVGGGPALGLPESALATNVHPDYEEVSALGIYAATALLCLLAAAGCSAGLLALRGDPRTAATVRGLLGWLPLGATIGVVATMVLAALLGYPTDPPTIALEAGIVAVGLLGATVRARLRALHPGSGGRAIALA